MEVQRFVYSAGGRLLGRVYLVPCEGPLGGAAPEEIMQQAVRAGARLILVDATHCPYGDSDGLRWLLQLKSSAEEQGLSVRVAAQENSRVWRNITLLNAGFALFSSVQHAWSGSSAPVTSRPEEKKERHLRHDRYDA